MLAEHPAVEWIDETGIGHHLGVWRPIPLAWATADGEPPPLTTFREVKRDLPDYLFSDAHRATWEPLLRDLVLDRLAVQHGAGRRMVIKEPGGSQVADWVMRLLPGSRLVFLLRDGRDVVDSWLDAYKPGGWHVQGDGGYPVAPAGREAFIRWQAAVWVFRTEAVQRAYEAHARDRRVLVKYEELRADPEGTLAGVYAAAGLDGGSELVRRAAERHAYENVSAAQRGQGKHIRSARPGGWRDRLSAAEQAAMDEILGPKLRELGYT